MTKNNEEMTDKQIIIDGVNVSGCEFYQIEANELYPKANYCGSMRNTFCEIEPNCYYKQLKRKEQECKQLREIMHKDFCTHYVLGECSQDHHDNCVGRNQCIKDLEQKCEELKEENKEIRKYQYEQDFLQQQLDQLKEELEAYKMEAEEGKEINAELKADNEELKEILNAGYLHNLTLMTERRVLLQTLADIKEIAEQIENNDLYVTVPAKAKIGDKIKINLIGIQDILNIINEVEDDRT